MSEQPQSNPSGEAQSPSTNAAPAALFAGPPREPGGLPVKPLAVAGLVILVIVAVLVIVSRKPAAPANTVLPPAAYATALPLSQLAMSESTSLSGGKSTFIDGHIQNSGNQTVTAATVQVLFRNDEALPPQIETVPLSLIRTREPYVDTQPISAAPLKPGDDREFRLIFETIPTNWNTQMPEIHIIRVETK